MKLKKVKSLYNFSITKQVAEHLSFYNVDEDRVAQFFSWTTKMVLVSTPGVFECRNN